MENNNNVIVINIDSALKAAWVAISQAFDRGSMAANEAQSEIVQEIERRHAHLPYGCFGGEAQALTAAIDEIAESRNGQFPSALIARRAALHGKQLRSVILDALSK